jgi:ASC-1-like (ASCH) protein
MATYDAPFHEVAFQHMEERVKTVYTMIATREFADMCSGDRLEFGQEASITVGMVRRYPDLDALMAGEGWQNVVPEAGSADGAARAIRALPDWRLEDERSLGVLALRVRDARRKGE